MSGVTIKWSPSPPFKWTKDPKPAYTKIAVLLKRMIDEQHRKGGNPAWKVSRRVEDKGGVTGHKTGRLWRGWRPRVMPWGAQCDNFTAYAEDFYDGHPERRVYVPASYRRIRRKAKLSGQKRAKKQTVAITMVEGHFVTERAQVARPITFPKKYVKLLEKTMAKFAATGKV